MRAFRIAWTLAVGAWLAIGPVAPVAGAAGDLTLLSTDSNGVKIPGNAGPGPGANEVPITPDGTTIAFMTTANYDPSDTGSDPSDPSNFDVYVKDLTTGAVTLVSKAANGTKANGPSARPSISADGNLVAFSTIASNLGPADTNSTADVYVKDLTTGTVTLVSASDAGQIGNNFSGEPSISADGTKVAFFSQATNLDGTGNPSGGGIFVKDLETGDLIQASVGPNGVADGFSFNGVISSDGAAVAFSSSATNLHPDDTDSFADIYVKTLATDELALASIGSQGTKGDSDSVEPSISGDGSVVAFASFAANLHPDDTDGARDIYARNLSTGQVNLVSASTSGTKADAESFTPLISGDGTVVGFRSLADNLDPLDSDAFEDIYVKNLASDELALVTVTASGVKANQTSWGPAGMTPSGDLVTFISLANNFVPEDTDLYYDIYLKELGEGPAAPGVPLNVTAAAGDAQASVSWSPPSSDGGSHITSYRIDGSSSAGNTTTTVGGTVTSTNISGLANGANYTFTVTAGNDVGAGQPSDPSGTVTPQAGAPAPQTTQESIPPSGGTATTDPGTGPTAADPLTTSITVPATASGGSVTIAETAVSQTPPGGYQFLGQQVDITSTAATSASNPLTIVFTIDDSLLLAATGMSAPPAEAVDITRAEAGSPAVIPMCTAISPALTVDPCVSNRQYIGGNLQITVLTSTASHWNAAVSPMRVTVSNAGYSPKAINSAQGAVITWTFTGTRQHSATDNLKLGPAKAALFSSGPRLSGSYGTALSAAGTYTYNSTVKGDPGSFAGSIAVPLKTSATTGSPTTQFSLSWSSSSMSGYVFDVRYRFMREGAKKWSDYTAWRSGTTALSGAFTPPSGAGKYAFTARLRNAGSGMASLWSPELTLTVH